MPTEENGSSAVKGTRPGLRKGDPSPWGPIDDLEPFGSDSLLIRTAGHGGLALGAASAAALPKAFRDALMTPTGEAGDHHPCRDWMLADTWCEEDCEAPIAAVILCDAGALEREETERRFGNLEDLRRTARGMCCWNGEKSRYRQVLRYLDGGPAVA